MCLVVPGASYAFLMACFLFNAGGLRNWSELVRELFRVKKDHSGHKNCGNFDPFHVKLVAGHHQWFLPAHLTRSLPCVLRFRSF